MEKECIIASIEDKVTDFADELCDSGFYLETKLNLKSLDYDIWNAQYCGYDFEKEATRCEDKYKLRIEENKKEYVL